MQGLSTFASRSNLTTRLVGEPLRNTRCHEVVRVQVPFHQQDLPTNSWSTRNWLWAGCRQHWRRYFLRPSDWFVARPNARRARLPLTRPSLALCPPFIQIVLQPMSSRSTVLLARTIWMKVPRFQLISRGLLSTPCTAARCYMGSHISPWMRFLQRCWRATCRRVGLTFTRMLSTFIQRTLGLYAYCPG